MDKGMNPAIRINQNPVFPLVEMAEDSRLMAAVVPPGWLFPAGPLLPAIFRYRAEHFRKRLSNCGLFRDIIHGVGQELPPTRESVREPSSETRYVEGRLPRRESGP